MSQDELRRTPLNALHRELGARMVPFGGWDMPVQYSSVLEEHRAVREGCGLFDVSHMGEFSLEGPDALVTLQRLTPNDVSKLAPGQAQYSALTTERGTFVDDILVYRRGESSFMLVVNASNIAKDFDWIRSHADGDLKLEDRSDATALLAVQGPNASELVARLGGEQLATLGYYRFLEGRVGELEGIVSRTGYTGEDGYELYVPADSAETLFRRLLAEGEKLGLKPCGLGARDTLRLEAKLPLYGNDIDDTTTVLEAGLGFIVKLDKGEFLGREVLAEQKANGAPRRLVGFEMRGRGIARHGYPVWLGGERQGEVTSGGPAPSLGTNIGLAYLPREQASVGQALEVEVRKQKVPAEVVKTPFYPHRTYRGAR